MVSLKGIPLRFILKTLGHSLLSDKQGFMLRRELWAKDGSLPEGS